MSLTDPGGHRLVARATSSPAYGWGMRVAALYDIHGNIDALDAVLADVEAQKIDLIVVGGDIAWGAFPAKTVARVQSLEQRALILRGNADREVADPLAADDPTWIDEMNSWCNAQLTASQKAFLADLPLTQTVQTQSLDEVLFCHGTPRTDDEIFTLVTPEEEIAAILTGVKPDVIVCGHTHTQFDRPIRKHRVINAGSVGMPYEDEPGAYWAIIGDNVELQRTEYDFAAAAERIRASDCPYRDRFADAVISPVRRDEAIANFENARRPAADS